MASLELVTFWQPRPPLSGLADHAAAPQSVQAAGWVYQQSHDAIYLASALTPDGPRGVTVIPKSAVTERTALLGYIPADTLTATITPDHARQR